MSSRDQESGPTDPDATLRDTTATRAGTSGSATRSIATRATTVSNTLLGPLQTLHLEEVRRIRVFAWLTMPFGVVVALVLPLSEHDPYTLGAMLSGFAAYVPVTILLLRSLRGASELPVLPVMLFGLGSLYAATAGIYYFGLFSPAVMGITFGLFFFSPSTSFRAALAIYLSGAAMHATLATAILTGSLVDRGIVRARDLGLGEQVLIQTLVQVVLFASFVTGRVTRRAKLSAIRAHDEAIEQLERRDELLAEARHELAEALGAGNLGHYSDQRLGSFVLGEVIGRGAMGEIYKGLHASSGEPAAVKLVHRHALSRPDQVRRFLREAKTAASIDSPHVCRVIELGGLDAELPYMAMELLSGQDLAELLRARSRLPLCDVIRLVREIGAGLDAVRLAGIVHRDVNPRNIFAVETESGPSFKLLDFGVAKSVDASVTTDDEVVGTPQYMAPELALGRAVTHRADLFSLAAVAYRALTGRAPFAGAGVPDTLLSVVHDMPVRPSEVASVPAELDLVMAIALAKEPERRFDSGAELQRAFERAARAEIEPELETRAHALLRLSPWRVERA